MAAAIPLAIKALPFIQTAAAVKGVYDANKARKEAQAAQAQNIAQAQAQSAAMEAQMAEQTKAQQETAAAAKAKLEAEQAKYAEEKATADKTATELAAKVDEERRKAGERSASAIRARTRGGRRALLSEARLNPEVGILGTQSNNLTGM